MSSDWLKEYPPEWSEISRKVLARDRFRCGACGLKNLSVIHRKASGGFILWGVTRNYKEGRVVAEMATRVTKKRHVLIVLSCAHLFDPSPSTVEEWNLGSRCQLCHHLLDRQMRSDNRRATWKRKRGEEPEKKAPDDDLFGDPYAIKDDDGDRYAREFFYRG